MEEWRYIDAFPDYEVSDQGRVNNHRQGRMLRPSLNQQGYRQVGLMRDGKQHMRSVTRIVADTFLMDDPPPENWNTPMHKDGDKDNLRVSNLIWRPRWYAVKYHQQFDYFKFHRKLSPIGIETPVIDVQTEEVFDNSTFCAIKNGLLETEIVLAITNKRPVGLTRQEFTFLSDYTY